MRILLTSHAFSPSIGGIESTSHLFAAGMAARGHEVTVVTPTPGPSGSENYKITRHPSHCSLVKLISRADVIWQNNISLNLLWPNLFVAKPQVITHQGVFSESDLKGAVITKLKRTVSRLGVNAFISTAVKRAQKLPGIIVPNPYDDEVFKFHGSGKRNKDIVFLGRLVPEKGAHVLLAAVEHLFKTKAMRLRVSIIGIGSELSNLKRAASEFGISGLVDFLGPMHGTALADQLNQHKVMAVPSLWDEPFGIVALEGIACGCAIVGSTGGGLPEAIGPCGECIEPGNPFLLANTLERLLTSNDGVIESYQKAARTHLLGFTPLSILDRYESLLADARDGAAL